jgi:hypothetical protein
MLSLIASDWQFSPILKLRSGTFFTVTTGVDSALSGQQNQRADLINPSAVYLPNQGVDGWISRTAFAAPATGTLGNLGIANFVGPGMIQFDLSIARTFKIREKQTFQLRAEGFNVPNHPNFSNPVSGLNSAVFGKIQSDISGTSGLSAGDYRVIQFALKYGF